MLIVANLYGCTPVFDKLTGGRCFIGALINAIFNTNIKNQLFKWAPNFWKMGADGYSYHLGGPPKSPTDRGVSISNQMCTFEQNLSATITSA